MNKYLTPCSLVDKANISVENGVCLWH